MTKPKIYTVAHPDELSAAIGYADASVDVVMASDYAALERQLSAVRQQLAAVTAENATMKFAIERHKVGFTVCEACGEDNGSWNDDVCSAIDETPATDAALAEIRAQGVDMAIEHLVNKFKDSAQIGVPVLALEWLAQLLRGEDSK